MGLHHAVLTVVLVLSAPTRISIAVLPTVLQVGGTVRITCTVPHHPDNRWLTIGIPSYRTSGGDLDGEAAPVTHTMYVDHMPCDVDEAVCEVTDALGKTYRAARPLIVAGCN